MNIEILGIISSIIILSALTFRSTSSKANILMRVINIIGSIGFIIYGFLIPAYSTAILNIGTVLVNIIYIVIEWRKIVHESL